MVIFGDGLQTRDFTFVSDTAERNYRGWDFPLLSRTNNQSGELARKFRNLKILAEMIAEVLGRPGADIRYTEPRPGDVVRLLSDSSRASELLRFKPTVALWDGLIHLRDWYAKHPKSAEELLEQEIERNWEIQERPTNAA